MRTACACLVLLGACRGSVTSEAPLSIAAGAPREPKPPTIACDLTLPPGWAKSPSPMPDHVLEAFALEPGSARFTGTIEVEESARTTMADAVSAAREEAATAWGKRPGYALVHERSIGAGTLLAYREGEPVTRHAIAVVPAGGAIAVARADEDESRGEAPLEQALGTLRCKRKE